MFFTCVDVGDLPLGAEGDDGAGATPAAGDAPARDGQEPGRLKLQHGARSSAVSGGEQRVVNLPSISLGPASVVVCLCFASVSLQFEKRGGVRETMRRTNHVATDLGLRSVWAPSTRWEMARFL